MTWATLQDRTNRATLAAFGVGIEIDGNATGADGNPMRADCTRPSDEQFLGGVSAVSGVPQAVVCTADLPDAPVGLPVVIASGELAGNWTVDDARHDGLGLTVLKMRAAA